MIDDIREALEEENERLESLAMIEGATQVMEAFLIKLGSNGSTEYNHKDIMSTAFYVINNYIKQKSPEDLKSQFADIAEKHKDTFK